MIRISLSGWRPLAYSGLLLAVLQLVASFSFAAGIHPNIGNGAKAGKAKTDGLVFRLFEGATPLNSELTTAGLRLTLRPSALDSILKLRPATMQLLVPSPEKLGMEWAIALEQNSVTIPGFKISSAEGKNLDAEAYLASIGTYKGRVLGAKGNSLAAISFFAGDMKGVLSVEGQNYDLGKNQDKAAKADQFLIYNSALLHRKLPFKCQEMGAANVHPLERAPQADAVPAGACYRLFKSYIECDNAMYVRNGSTVQGTANYVIGLYNVVTAMYAIEQIPTAISEIFVWDTPDLGYNTLTSSAAYLGAFVANRPTVNGDLGHFLSTRGINVGGIAYVNVLCANGLNKAFSNIYNNYQQLPTYSWDVMVMTHEMGHNLGSPHTQSCSWPGGALDNCYTTEGGCAQGPAPTNGGTVMSYCHLTGYGINLANGFGPLPGALIRDRVFNAGCLSFPAGSTMPAASCIPVAAGQGQPTGAGPVLVVLQAMSNATSANTGTDFFKDYTCSKSTTLALGTSYTIAVSTANVEQNVRAWIDYNADLAFDSTELILNSLGIAGASNQEHSATFLVPAGANTNLALRLRVVADLTTNPESLACSNIVSGQAEDYRVVITDGMLSPGILAEGNESICAGGDPGIIAFATLPNATAHLQWYYKNGILPAPAATATTHQWVKIVGQTLDSFDPPAGIAQSRTYACRVALGLDTAWASGARQVQVSAAFNPGQVLNSNQNFAATGGDPANVALRAAPAGGGPGTTYGYKWYSAAGLVAPQSGSLFGWSEIANATGPSFDPSFITTSTSYACFITPSGPQTCGLADWARGSAQIGVGEIYMSNGTTTTCSAGYYDSQGPSGNYLANENYSFTALPAVAGNKLRVTFSAFETNPAADTLFIYDGTSTAAPKIATLAGAYTAGTLGAFTATNPDGALSFKFKSKGEGQGSIGGFNSFAGWQASMSCIQPITFGTLAAADQVLCSPINGAPVAFATVPTGAASFAYQWYFKVGTFAAPQDGSGIAGWTKETSGGNQNQTFDPPAGRTSSRTYACFVTPAGSIPNWASGARTNIIRPAFAAGTLAAGNQTLANPADPGPIVFAIAAAGISEATYSWYFQNGIVPAPTGGSTAGWQEIPNASLLNVPSYDPPAGLAQSRTYACFVSPMGSFCGVPTWAGGARQITVQGALPLAFGTLALSDEVLCSPANGAPSGFSVLPTGAASFTYQWYARTGNFAAPTGTSTTGWNLETAGGNRNPTFDPPAGRTSSRTYACFVTPAGLAGAWATGRKQVLLSGPCLPAGSPPSPSAIWQQGVDEKASLGQNVPNPASGETTIDLFIPEGSSEAILRITHLDGRLVESVTIRSTGSYTYTVSSKSLAAGVYAYSLVVDGALVATKRMVVL